VGKMGGEAPEPQNADSLPHKKKTKTKKKKKKEKEENRGGETRGLGVPGTT